MPDLEVSGVQLVADASQYDRAMRQVIAGADRVDAALDQVVSSANRAERAVNDIDGNVSIKANVDASELDTAKRKHDDIDTNTNTVASVDDSEITGALDLVSKLAQPITIAVGIGGAAAGLLGAAAGTAGVSGLIEMDTALSKIEGTTGRLIPQAEALIVDLYTNAWGESRTQIADTVVAASKLGIANEDMAEAVQAAFLITDQTGGDTAETLRTLDSLVKNNLAPDFQTAADIITVGLQTGGDRGDDLLDTFNEYGSTFKTLRISGEGALGLINSGLDAGIDNSDRIADALRETGIRLREIGTNPEIAKAFTQLDNLSDVDLQASFDAYNAGEISGDEFFAGFFESLRQASEQDPEAAAGIAATLVGTISEDFGPEVIAQLTPQWDGAMGTLEGRAQEASDTINANLGTALVGLQRTLEQEFSNILTDVVDTDALIDRAKEAITVFSSELRGGASISEAAAIALEISPASIQQFESIVGNLALTLAGAIATALDVLGQGDAAESLRASIAGAAQQQLVFDLKLADDGSNIETALQTAAARGLNPETIADSINQAVQELATSGDVAGAQAFADFLTGMIAPSGEDAVNAMIDGIGQQIAGGPSPLQRLLGAGEDVNVGDLINLDTVNAAVTEAANNAVDAFNQALDTGDFETARAIAESLDQPELLALISDAQTKFVELAVTADTSTTGISKSAETMDAEVSAALKDNTASVGDWSNQTAKAIDRVADAYAAVAAQATAALNAQMAFEGGGATDTKAAGGDLNPGNTWTGELGPEIIASDGSGSVVNAARSQELMQAISAIARIPARGGGSGTVNNIYLNQTNNTRHPAQASMIGSTTANQVRGFVS